MLKASYQFAMGIFLYHLFPAMQWTRRLQLWSRHLDLSIHL